MSDQASVPETRAFELHDQIGEEAGLIAPRPDKAEALAYFNELRDKWTLLDRQYPSTRSGTVPDDLENYGKIKAEKEALEFALDYMSWYQTAKVGYIYIYIYICQDHTTQHRQTIFALLRHEGQMLWPHSFRSRQFKARVWIWVAILYLPKILDPISA